MSDTAKMRKTGLPGGQPVRRRPTRLTAAQMQTWTRLVFDIQDVGARFYTYSCTMLYALEEAAKAKMPFYVLDRPNPITGTHVEGPMLDKGTASRSSGATTMPLRHGMTFGELATMATRRTVGRGSDVIQDAELAARRLVRFDDLCG